MELVLQEVELDLPVEEELLEVLLFLELQQEVEEQLQEPYNWLIAIFQKYSSLPEGQPAFFQL